MIPHPCVGRSLEKPSVHSLLLPHRRGGTRIGRQMDDRLEAIERFREALDRIEGRDRRGDVRLPSGDRSQGVVMLQSGHQDSTYRPVGAGYSNVRVASHISSTSRQSDGRQQNGAGPLVPGGRFEI